MRPKKSPRRHVYKGYKETLYHARMRPNQPIFTPSKRSISSKPGLYRLLEVEGDPIEEWFRVIRGDGSMPLSNFDYVAPLTEMVLLGALAQRIQTNH